MNLKRVDAAIAAALVLLLVYVLSLAPDVTFWDAGEFIAAAHSFGIPHPPGTPLFILLLRAWAELLPLPYAVATNLFSAAATALAGGLIAALVRRGTGSSTMAVAAALVAGGMSSVWLNATETEVYAASLALAMLALWCGERAGRSEDERWTLLTAYVIALSVPLHLSALVAAPAAIVLATVDWPVVRWRRLVVLAGVFLLAMGAGRVSPWLSGAGAIVTLLALAVRERDPRAAGPAEHTVPFAAIAVAGVAVSALAVLIVRARHDPAVNQGNPATLTALADVVARRQYAVAPMWPRMAPLWMQLGNFVQYADWQAALGFEPAVGPAAVTFAEVAPAIARTIGTVAFLALGILGAVTHRRRDPRSWWGILVLLLCGSLGVVAYLNLHAGPSFMYGAFTPDIAREARERDYFFVFAFVAWGMWAGVGAVAFTRTLRWPEWSGLLLAALPIVLNWRAVNRHREPESALPRLTAEAFLQAAPPSAVLFVAGDNDSYPLWYAQQVLGLRRDVAVVTVPLLPTEWYRAEIARRFGLLDTAGVSRFDGTMRVAERVAAGARARGRPVAASIMLTPGERVRLGGRWAASGMTYVAVASDSGATLIDAKAARASADFIASHAPGGEIRPAIDLVDAYFRRLLECPRQLADAAATRDSTRLDSVCNYR